MVSDERLAGLVELYESANDALDMLDQEQWQDIEDLLALLRELQQRRAQRCETCAHTDPDPNVAPGHVWCGFYGMAQLGTISCPNWEGKEVEG